MAFDRAAALSYLRRMFGTNKGFVAVALKKGKGKADWSELNFLWPLDKERILDWAQANARYDVFICPALRRDKGRRKGQGAHLQWLWADVDFQSIPDAQRALIKRRIARLGTYVYASGSGDNRHVYVKLSKPVTLDVWRRLNQGLRDYLMADAKYTDNALLRLPGTRNYKPGGGRVVLDSNEGVVRRPEQLLKLRAWQDVVVVDDTAASDGTWETVDVKGLIRGAVKLLVNMDLDEAVGRYQSRHAAVYQVAAKLSKRGFTSDQIHSLMAGFKPGLSKEADERGYDMHADISRCLAANPTREAVDDDAAIAVTEAVEELEEAEDQTPEEVLRSRVLKEVERLDVGRLARQYLAQRDFAPPPPETTHTLAEALEEDRPPTEYTVDKWAARGQNVTITGQYKSGKTMLATNLVRALCDHTPFLDDRKVRQLSSGQSVGLWSLEMSKNDLLDQYLIPQSFDHPQVLQVFHGRGYGVNLLTDVGRAWAVNWLRGCAVWVIDSFARICRMAGVDENDNGSVLELLHRLDEIKLEAGVEDLFVLAHTGRAVAEEGRERARGATVLDDWADARWVFTRDGNVRFLAVEGRSVEAMPATSLTFDEGSRRMTLSGQDKVDARLASATALIVSLVSEVEDRYYNVTSLKKVYQEKAGMKSDKVAAAAIKEAVDTGFIELLDGPRNSKLVQLTPKKSNVEGARATVRVLDMTKVRDPRVRGRRDKNRRAL